MSEEQDRFVSTMTRAAGRLMGQRKVPAELLARISSTAQMELDESSMGKVADFLDQMLGEEDGTRAQCLPYPGGKCKIGHQIIDLMPKHENYIEVFGGSGACLLLKPRASGVEVYNDVSPYLHSLMTVLGNKPQATKLHRRLTETLAHRDVASRTFLKHREWRREHKDPRELEPDVVERALVLLIGLILHMTPVDADELFFRHNPGLNQRLMRAQALNGKVLNLPELAARMTGVQVYNLDWRKLIRIVDKQATRDGWNAKQTLFYIDPPYVEDSIVEGFNGYYGAAGTAFDLQEHDDLVTWILKTPAKVMLSGKAHKAGPLQRLEQSKKIRRHDIQSRTRGQNALVESVWCNF